MYSLARLIYAIAKDGLLPKAFGKVSERHQTPANATIFVGVLAAIFGGLVPLDLLAEIINFVTLAYLIMMAFGILRLRKMEGAPTKEQFKTPFMPVLPIVSILVSLYLIWHLQVMTWLVFAIAAVMGILIYALYGFQHSVLNKTEE
jgi:APA family basic amino acid/polyamine antiporter